MLDEYGRLTYDEFCDLVEKVYSKFPKEYQFPIFIQEKMPKGFNEIQYGFYKFDDKAIVLCYWGFKAMNNFSPVHIENVIKHELNHFIAVDKLKGIEEDIKNKIIDDNKNSKRLIWCPKCKEISTKLINLLDENNETIKVIQICLKDECDYIELLR